MTAAEVAALPVVEVEEPDALEPHASGGLGSATGDSTSGSVDADGSDEPSGAGGSSAPSPDPAASSDGAADDAEPIDPVLLTDTAAVRVVSVEGGRASFSESNGALLLLWATPQPGFVATTVDQAPTTITVAFSSSLGVWVVEADLIGDRIVVTTRPEPLT